MTLSILCAMWCHGGMNTFTQEDHLKRDLAARKVRQQWLPREHVLPIYPNQTVCNLDPSVFSSSSTLNDLSNAMQLVELDTERFALAMERDYD